MLNLLKQPTDGLRERDAKQRAEQKALLAAQLGIAGPAGRSAAGAGASAPAEKDVDGKTKPHKFWSTQPVPKSSTLTATTRFS
jgi:hypothetical protein